MKILNKIIFVVACSLSGIAIFASQVGEELMQHAGIAYAVDWDLQIYISDGEARKKIAKKISDQFAGKEKVKVSDVFKAIEIERDAYSKLIELSGRIEKVFCTLKVMLPNSKEIIDGWYKNFQEKRSQNDIVALQEIRNFLKKFIIDTKAGLNPNAAAAASASVPNQPNAAADQKQGHEFSANAAADEKQSTEADQKQNGELDAKFAYLKSELTNYLNNFSDLACRESDDEFEKMGSEQEIIHRISRFNAKDVDTITDENGNTLLILSARARCLPAVKKLTAMGARNFDTRNRLGYTVCNYANKQIIEHIRNVLDADEAILAAPLMVQAEAFAEKQQKKRAVSQLNKYAQLAQKYNLHTADLCFKGTAKIRAKHAFKQNRIIKNQVRMNKILMELHADQAIKSEALKQWKLRLQALRDQQKRADEFETSKPIRTKRSIVRSWNALAQQQKQNRQQQVDQFKTRKNQEKLKRMFSQWKTAKDNQQRTDAQLEKKADEFRNHKLTEKSFGVMFQQNQLAKQHRARQALAAQQAAAAQAGADRKYALERATRGMNTLVPQRPQAVSGNVAVAAHHNPYAGAIVPAAAQEPTLQIIEAMGRIGHIPYSRVVFPPGVNPNMFVYDASLVYPANFLMYHHSQVMQYYAYLRSLQR